MRVRPATRDDLPQMIAIERASDTAAHWGQRQYEALFDPASLPRIVLVADVSEQDLIPAALCQGPCGFIVARALGPEWEIENIVVETTLRRSGMGTRLLTALLDRAVKEGSTRMFLEVRESNIAARKLYEKRGFVEIARRGSYYTNPTEDALVLQLEFSGTALENA